MKMKIKLSGDGTRNIFLDKRISIGAKLLYLYYYKLYYTMNNNISNGNFNQKLIPKSLSINIRTYFRYAKELKNHEIISHKKRSETIMLMTSENY